MMPEVKQCKEANAAFIACLGERIHILKAEDTIDGQGLTSKQREMAQKKLQQLDCSADKTAGLPSNLSLCQKARVMLLRNLDLGIGLANGRMGTVTAFKFIGDSIRAIQVSFDGDAELIDIERVTAKFELAKDIYANR